MDRSVRQVSLAIVAVAVLAAACGSTNPSSVPSNSAAAPHWDVPASVLPSDAPATLVTAITTLPGPTPIIGTGFAVSSVRTRTDWAVVFGHAAASTSAAVAPTEMIVVVAHRTSTGWQLVTDHDMAAFCTALAELPTTLMNPTERSYFACP
jgi:hypothetical protein